MRRLVLIGSVTVLTVLIAVACGGEDSPTPTVAQDSRGGAEATPAPTSTVARDGSGGSEVTAVPTSTVARDGSGGSEVTAVPTSTVAPDSSSGSEATAVPTSTVAPDSSGRSDLAVAEVAEYAAWCVEWQVLGEPDPDLTWGQGAESFSEVVDAYENKSAPEELKALHDAVAALLKAMHDFIRMQDASEPFSNVTFSSNDEIKARVDAFSDASDTLDLEVVLQLLDVGCYFS